MTLRRAATGAILVGLLLAASAAATSAHGEPSGGHGTHAAATPSALPHRVILLDPANGAVIGEAPPGTHRIVILNPATGAEISSVGWSDPGTHLTPRPSIVGG